LKLTLASVHWLKTNFVCVFASLDVGDLVSTLVVGTHIGNAAFLQYLIFFSKIKEQSGDYGVREDGSIRKVSTFDISSNQLFVEKKAFHAE
jgi:hypothetical protein